MFPMQKKEKTREREVLTRGEGSLNGARKRNSSYLTVEGTLSTIGLPPDEYEPSRNEKKGEIVLSVRRTIKIQAVESRVKSVRPF